MEDQRCRRCGVSLPDRRYRYCSKHRQRARREANRLAQARYVSRNGQPPQLGTGRLGAFPARKKSGEIDFVREGRAVREELIRLTSLPGDPPKTCEECGGRIVIMDRGEAVCEDCGLVY